MTNFENLKQIYEKIEVQDIDIRKKKNLKIKQLNKIKMKLLKNIMKNFDHSMI